MNNSIPRWQMAGFIAASILGTLLHFLFDLAGGSLPAALISAVNESIWEHMKLLYFALLLFALAEYFAWGKHIDEFWCVKLKGTLLGLGLIPVIYYTYTGIFGTSLDWVNISIFFLSAGITYWWETGQLQNSKSCNFSPRLSLILLLSVSILFTVLTFFPPQIPFFRDPQTGSYGFS